MYLYFLYCHSIIIIITTLTITIIIVIVIVINNIFSYNMYYVPMIVVIVSMSIFSTLVTSSKGGKRIILV